MERLRSTLEEEARQAGFVLLDHHRPRSRGAVLAHAGALDGRAAQARCGAGSADEPGIAMSREMGLHGRADRSRRRRQGLRRAGASTASSPSRRRRWRSSGRRRRATSPTCGRATDRLRGGRASRDRSLTAEQQRAVAQLVRQVRRAVPGDRTAAGRCAARRALRQAGAQADSGRRRVFARSSSKRRARARERAAMRFVSRATLDRVLKGWPIIAPSTPRW